MEEDDAGLPWTTCEGHAHETGGAYYKIHFCNSGYHVGRWPGKSRYDELRFDRE